jgi:hypothetical protein
MWDWVSPVVTLLSVGVGVGAVLVQLKRVVRDVHELVGMHRHVEERIDKVEQELADLRGRLMERLRASQSSQPVERTPPRGTRLPVPPRRPPVPTGPPIGEEDDDDD